MNKQNIAKGDIAKGTLFIMFGQAAFMLSGYVLNVFLGRTLGPELYGIFGILTAILFTVERLFFGSISRGITKFIAEKESVGRSILSYALKVQVLLSFAIYLVFYVAAPQVARLLGDLSLTRYLQILSFLIIISGFYFIPLAALNGMRSFDKQAIIWSVFSFARVFFVVLMILAGFSLMGVFWGLVFAGLVCLFLAIYYCKAIEGYGYFERKALLNYSSKVIAFTFAMLFLMNIDLLSIKIILKENLSAGLYAAVLNLARIPTIFVFPISIVMFPLLAKFTSENDTNGATMYLNRTLRSLLLISVPFAFMISATAPSLITLVYGKAYLAASDSLRILIFGMTLMTITIFLNTIILVSSNLNLFISFNFLLVFLDIVLNYIFIKKLGIIGASLATTVTCFIAYIFSFWYACSYFPIKIKWSSWVSILVSSSIIYLMACNCTFSGILLIPAYLVLYIVYLLILFLLREINDNDVKLLKNLRLIVCAVGRNQNVKDNNSN